MIIYSYFGDEESHYFSSKREALREAKAFAKDTPGGIPVEVKMLEIPHPTKSLFLDILNRRGFVTGSKIIATFYPEEIDHVARAAEKGITL